MGLCSFIFVKISFKNVVLVDESIWWSKKSKKLLTGVSAERRYCFQLMSL